MLFATTSGGLRSRLRHASTSPRPTPRRRPAGGTESIRNSARSGCSQLPQWRCGRTPRNRARDLVAIDRHDEFGLACSPVDLGQPCLIVVVDQAVRTTQRVVGVITLSRNPASLGILARQGSSDEEAHSGAVQLKLKPTPSLGISNRPSVPMIMMSSSRACAGAVPCRTNTKRSRANSG